jgi:cation diffusion facilitator CzcD-associated flavoprotein CzcO
MIDIVIIGAGPSGLCAAKNFLQYDANADVTILDAQGTVGGVWSKEQIYPTLKTNNLWSAVDFIDFPMDSSFGIEPGQHVTGEAMHSYLEAYAKHFGIMNKIQFHTFVVSVRRKTGGGWVVDIARSNSNGVVESLDCRKLVVATGVLSVPNMPSLDGATDFKGDIIHSSDLGRSTHLLTEKKSVAVLGGSKSAYDSVYLSAISGLTVDWIIRTSGRGPVWVFPPHTYLGPFKAWRERLVVRRIFSFMSPSILPDFSGFGWLRNFLHFNVIGKKISQTFWKLMHADTIHDCRYHAEPHLAVLEPEQSPFW